MSTEPAPPPEEATLAQAGQAGIHRLPIPTPFRVGRVNAYLIEDSPLTLIDSGPNSAKSLDELEQGLAAIGHRVEDLELLVITHQHVDHLGLAAVLARRSGAGVVSLDRLAPYLEGFNAQADADNDFALQLMLRHGIAQDVAMALRAVTSSYRAWGQAVRVTHPVRDGDEIALRDRALRVLYRPGHSPSDIVLHDEASGILLAGDHLIARVSSNPLVTRPLGQADGTPVPDSEPRPRALMVYLESLRATQQMELDLVLPGHGPPITEHVGLIDARLRLHARRADKIHGLIASEPLTAHEIAERLWGELAVTQAYLTISEVLGHVDLLLDDGRARELDDPETGVVRFVAA